MRVTAGTSRGVADGVVSIGPLDGRGAGITDGSAKLPIAEAADGLDSGTDGKRFVAKLVGRGRTVMALRSGSARGKGEAAFDTLPVAVAA